VETIGPFVHDKQADIDFGMGESDHRNCAVNPSNRVASVCAHRCANPCLLAHTGLEKPASQ
jgi:hypothetical protein